MAEETTVVEETPEVVAEPELKEVEDSVLDETVAQKLLQEVKTGRREWEYDGKKYVTRFPTAGEESEARWAYARAFNKALDQDLPTQKELRKTLERRGIWGEEDEKKVEGFRNKIVQLEGILSKKSPKDKSKKTRSLVEDLLENRANILEMTGSLTEYMNQTVESIAEEAKTAQLVSFCTEDSDGERLWETPEDYLSAKDTSIVNAATFQYMTFTNGLPEDYLGELTEIKFLRAGRDEASEEK